MRFSRRGGFALPFCWTKFVLVLWFLVPSALNAQAPTVFPGGVVNGASFAAGPIAAGSQAAVFGSNLASSTAPAGSLLSLPTNLSGTSLTIGGLMAPLFFVSPFQIDFQVPWELAGQAQASLTVTTGSGTSSPVTVNLAAFGDLPPVIVPTRMLVQR